MSVTPHEPTAAAVQGPLLRTSISVKLPLFIGALIALVVAINTWGDYRTRVSADRAHAADRLTQVANEFADMLELSREEYTAHMASLAQAPALHDCFGPVPRAFRRWLPTRWTGCA